MPHRGRGGRPEHKPQRRRPVGLGPQEVTTRDEVLGVPGNRKEVVNLVSIEKIQEVRTPEDVRVKGGQGREEEKGRG